MSEDTGRPPDPRAIRSDKPGDRVLRVRSRSRRLPLIRHRAGPVAAAIDLFVGIAVATPVVPLLVLLVVLTALVPVPIYFLERGGNPQASSYWDGLWWAVAAMTTAGYSGIVLMSTGGQIVGSIYTVTSVGLFYGAVLAAFSAYFIMVWRRPRRMLLDTVIYYLQRADRLTAEELDGLSDLTEGLLRAGREGVERRHPPDRRSGNGAWGSAHLAS